MGHVTLTELAAGQTYYYCLLLEGARVMSRPYPSFQTAPTPAPRGHVRVAFSSCVGYYGYNSAPGYADLATRTNVDLVILLGDNHYANTTDPVKQREAYFAQRATAGYRALGSTTPIYAIWDDHDFGPNNSDGTLQNKEVSLKTFQEHWANPAYGETDNPGVYYQFSRGGVEFFMLDDRYHRSPNTNANVEAKTMLGPRQLQWLKRGLANSPARVKLVGCGSEWQSNGTEDSWSRFTKERQEIFDFIREQQIQGVIFITGDRHFTAAYQTQGNWIEVTSGPLGSSNAKSKPVAEMFFKQDAGRMYSVFDIDTRPEEPIVTLEVYQVAQGLIYSRSFSWDEINGRAKIPGLVVDELPATESK